MSLIRLFWFGLAVIYVEAALWAIAGCGLVIALALAWRPKS